MISFRQTWINCRTKLLIDLYIIVAQVNFLNLDHNLVNVDICNQFIIVESLYSNGWRFYLALLWNISYFSSAHCLFASTLRKNRPSSSILPRKYQSHTLFSAELGIEMDIFRFQSRHDKYANSDNSYKPNIECCSNNSRLKLTVK